MSIAEQVREESIRLIAGDRRRAHEILFRHRHDKQTPAFHGEIIDAQHSSHPKVVIEAFRGGGKSTLSEEAMAIQAVLGEFRNGLIIGASEARACERLEAIGHELETNEDLIQLFGEQVNSKTWNTDRKLLLSGTILQAKGAGQALRGTKYHDQRPDYILIDDLEDEESVRTPQARHDMLRWVYKALIPAGADNLRIRFIGNRLDPKAVIVEVAKDPSWKHLRYPVRHLDIDSGERRAVWGAKFPLERIDAIEAEYRRQGLHEDFNQEYLCEADTPEARVFRPEHFEKIVRPRVRTWEATWCMVDPARSVNKRSATTAMPTWSWINNRCVIWDCPIGHWLPDEIITRMFDIDTAYRPVVMGVEEDALNQFILQPLRQQMVARGQPLPLRAMAAKGFTQGRGKEEFIKSLQPFFAAGEIEFAKDLPDLKAQFLSFPTGLIDGPNALAYMLRMRPGGVMYDDFTQANIVESVAVAPMLPVHLVLNATQTYVTAAVVQFDGQRLSVLADYVDEGDPGQIAVAVVRRANIEAQGRTLRVVVPPLHFEQYANVGLRAALNRVPIDCNRGGEPTQGRDELRALFRASVRGMPAVQVSWNARWTLNAFSGGYCRSLKGGGAIADEPEQNFYATLMAGIESFCALTRVSAGLSGGDDDNMRLSADGRRYRSAMVDRRH